ncbi:MAG: SMP-30/gluconolactonase/LRE family protein, partial [Chloroflexi bacterium]|nr:SMP-30/gluconolactonase/LRE family protein [Chloroflexota bacterium]
DELADLLQELGVAEPWRWSEALAAAGADEDWLRRLGQTAGDAIDAAISWVAATLQADSLTAELADSTERMSSLVGAVKSYAFMDRGTIAVMRDGKIERVIVDEIPAERQSRFNDVFADPHGRVFCGTMPSPNGPGRLYRLDLDGSLTVVIEDVLCSNGMGYTPDGKQMYFTDSERYTIYLFDYDEATGSLSNRRIFVQHAPELGLPDGMTVDADGFVWSAHWDGNALYRYDASGREVLRIPFPVRKVSSVIFGGDDLSDMYITTAGGDQKATDGEHAGALYRLRIPGVRGTPEHLSRVGL